MKDHETDWIESVRRTVIPIIGMAVSLLEEVLRGTYYKNKEQREKQFVAQVEQGVEEFEAALHEMGYHRNPLAWIKERELSEIEESSWRKTTDCRQVHLVCYDGEKAPNASSGETYIYAHEEYRWDRHPYWHLIGKDVEYKDAVIDVQKDLQEEGIEYNFVQPG